MADFPSSPKPDYPVEETPVEPEVLVSTHRDGSEQRRLKGPGKLRLFRLRFGGSMPIAQLDKDAIETHFAGQNGMLDPFVWTHPERPETPTVRYAETPRFSHVGFNFYTAEVAFQEVPA